VSTNGPNPPGSVRPSATRLIVSTLAPSPITTAPPEIAPSRRSNPPNYPPPLPSTHSDSKLSDPGQSTHRLTEPESALRNDPLHAAEPRAATPGGRDDLDGLGGGASLAAATSPTASAEDELASAYDEAEEEIRLARERAQQRRGRGKWGASNGKSTSNHGSTQRRKSRGGWRVLTMR